MNIPIKPISCQVIESFLYNNDLERKGLINAEIIGISTYIEQPITFHLLLEGKFIYSDLPITSFVHHYDKNVVDSYNIKDLSHVNCKTLEVDNFTFNIFQHKTIAISLREKDEWLAAEYLTSFDFYTGNELLHLVKLDNGLFGLFPNHKINFVGDEYLPNYKKNKFIWKV